MSVFLISWATRAFISSFPLILANLLSIHLLTLAFYRILSGMDNSISKSSDTDVATLLYPLFILKACSLEQCNQELLQRNKPIYTLLELKCFHCYCNVNTYAIVWTIPLAYTYQLAELADPEDIKDMRCKGWDAFQLFLITVLFIKPLTIQFTISTTVFTSRLPLCSSQHTFHIGVASFVSELQANINFDNI